jgi:hypothetical protein
MRRPQLGLLFVLVLVWGLLVGCQSPDNDQLRPPAPLAPAWLHEDQHDLAEVRAIIAEIVGPGVLVADDALRRTHVLTIERYPHQDAEGRLIQGREMSAPVTFELLRQNDRCYLHLRASNRYWRLQETLCVPADVR